MPRGSRKLQVSFAGGEMSPEMYSRFDDDRFRLGAARLRNFTTHPHGPASRRPGFALVRAAKNSLKKVRLLPFRFSADDTYAIEMGRHTADGLDLGYFRFHTMGGTLLQPYPEAYREPETATALNTATDELTLGTHGYQTGDPVVLTMEATTETVTFDTATNEAINASHGFLADDPVLFRTTGTLPAEIEPGRVYYVRNQTANRFQVAKKPLGQPIDLTTAGSGTMTVACIPNPLTNPGGLTFHIDVNTTYYAIRRSATTIAIAATRADAVEGLALNFVLGTLGTIDRGDVRVHYDYRPGDVAYSGASPFYCFKIPWGTPGARQVNLNDHLDHAPSSFVNYWMRQSGSDSVVTFNTGTDRVLWTTHGLSNGDPVTFTTTGSLPPELTVGVTYYVRNKGTDDFQLSATVHGAIIDLTGSPAATTTAFANGFFEVPHFFAEDALFDVSRAQSNDVMTLTHVDRPVVELRRYGQFKWVLADVIFNGELSPPTGIEITPFVGEGATPNDVGAGNPAEITFTGAHNFLAGEAVMVVNMGSVGIPDGTYVVGKIVASSDTKINLREFESGDWVGPGAGTPASDARIRSSAYAEDWSNTYVVTAVSDRDAETAASDEVTIENNLLVPGANNRITWEPVAGAARYRVYKEVNGLFGFIGEVDAPEVTFLDENVGPDLSITPPIPDTSLRKEATVTFNTTKDTVGWVGHGLEEYAPVVFDSDGTFPTNVVFGVTYYVFNPTEDTFQIVASPGSTTIVNISGSPSGIHKAVSGMFPAAVGYFDQRRVFAGPRLRPQDFWLTASGTESDLSYTIPSKDTNRIYNRVAAGEFSPIRHVASAGHLILLSSAAEYRLTPLDGGTLVPGDFSVRAPTHVGASTVAPVQVNNTVLFGSARGNQVREMGFYDRVGDYVTGDISLRSSHLFETAVVKQMSYQQTPYPIVWAVLDSGVLLGLTYAPDEQVAGWHTHDIDGLIESCVSVAEGSEDRLYVVSNRNGTRYIERLGSQRVVTDIADAMFLDSSITYDGAAISSLFVPHLTSATVTYLADGVIGTGTVNGSGLLTLATLASKVHVGLRYSHDLHTLPFGLNIDAAFGTGVMKNVTGAWLRTRNSGGFKVGPLGKAPVTQVSSATLSTGLTRRVLPGDWSEDAQVHIQGDDPLPLIVVGLTLEVSSGG